MLKLLFITISIIAHSNANNGLSGETSSNDFNGRIDRAILRIKDLFAQSSNNYESDDSFNQLLSRYSSYIKDRKKSSTNSDNGSELRSGSLSNYGSSSQSISNSNGLSPPSLHLSNGLNTNNNIQYISGYDSGLKSSSNNQQNYESIYNSNQPKIQRHRTVEIEPMITEPHGNIEPQIIDVSPDSTPLTIHFKTYSNPLQVEQSRDPVIVPEVEHKSYEDEPKRVVHEVVKPVIQEVREIIQPYRRVVQRIEPVVEEIQTIVAKGEGRGVSAQNTDANQNTNYLPQGAFVSAQGVPVYRSLYTGPAIPNT